MNPRSARSGLGLVVALILLAFVVLSSMLEVPVVPEAQSNGYTRLTERTIRLVP